MNIEEGDTRALRALREAGIAHEVSRNERARSVEEAAAMRGIPVDSLLKSLVVRRADDDYVFVLVPGDREIDWPKLRTLLGVRRLSLPSADEARDATGYERGTITPFGSTHAWPVIADSSIAGKTVVSLGAGAHGVSVKLATAALLDSLAASVADVTRPSGDPTE